MSLTNCYKNKFILSPSGSKNSRETRVHYICSQILVLWSAVGNLIGPLSSVRVPSTTIQLFRNFTLYSTTSNTSSWTSTPNLAQLADSTKANNVSASATPPRRRPIRSISEESKCECCLPYLGKKQWLQFHHFQAKMIIAEQRTQFEDEPLPIWISYQFHKLKIKTLL